MKKFNNELIREVNKLSLEGYSVSAIAEKTGLTEFLVCQILRKK